MNNICKYEDCKKPMDVNNYSIWCTMHRNRLYKGIDMDKPTQTHRTGMSAYDNVMSQVVEVGECLEFTGFIAANGYGRVETKDTGEVSAHRVVAAHHLGESNKIVLHSCDNPKCVNIKHLRYGTHKENGEDKSVRLRQPRGEENPKSYLTEREVLEIFRDKRPSRLTALDFGCSAKTVRNIRNGTTWSWLTLPGTAA